MDSTIAGSVNARSLQGRSCWLQTITLWTKKAFLILLTDLVLHSHEHSMVVFVRLSGKTVVICLHLFEGSFTVNILR
jgi:hypothetical protein